MKNKLIKVFIVIFVFINFVSCSKNNNISQKPTESIALLSKTGVDYNMYTNAGSEDYNNFILENPVDKAFYNDYPETGVTSEMMEYEAKFADIWKSEMKFSIENLAAILNKDDGIKLHSLQSEWLEKTNQILGFEHELLSNEEYGVGLGSLFLVSQRESYKNAYRTRTFQIKYIHFLLETQCDNSKSISECESLKFLFKE